MIGYMSQPRESRARWALLSGHGHVLVEIARNPGARIRDIAPVVDLTERTVQAIVADLVAAGYLTRTRTGRRNHYTVNPNSPFRHGAQDGQRVGPLLDLLTATGAVTGRAASHPSRPQAGHNDTRIQEPGTGAADAEPAG
jgi:predicted transcriptional regulator